MNEQLKVLVVGAGDMGKTHIKGYQKQKGVTITALVDSDAERAKKAAGEFGIPATYADYQIALKKEKPDIVSVCVPASYHAEVTIAALQEGANVLVEKPLALTIADAERMLAASQKSKGKLCLIFQRRFLGLTAELKKRLPSLGQPLTYQATDFRSIRPKILMHSKSGNGGPVIDCCVHDFDYLRQFFGEPKRLFAVGETYGAGKEELQTVCDLAIDTAFITLDFAGGQKAVVLYSWGLPVGHNYWGGFEFLGPNGAIKCFWDRLEHYLPHGRLETVAGLNADGHGAEIAAFVDAVKKNTAVPVNPEDGLAALKIAYATLQSIATGQIVTLP